MFQESISNPADLLKDGGIPKSLLYQSKVDVEHLICPICLNILWKPVACGQDRCFQSFCEVCVNRWIQEHSEQSQAAQQPQATIATTLNQLSIYDYQFQTSLFSTSYIHPFNSNNSRIEQSDYTSSSEDVEYSWTGESRASRPEQEPKCPKCRRPFKRTSIPILRNLLDSIQLNCIHEGCKEKPGYEQFLKHIMNCPARKIECSGCKRVFLQQELEEHESDCEFVQVHCSRCQSKMPRKEYQQEHSKEQCIQQQFVNKDAQIVELNKQISQLCNKNHLLEQRLERLIRGELEHIQNITFKTSFQQNYLFHTTNTNSEAKLVRPSFNQTKQKNDYLHFYINMRIKTQSVIGVQWRVQLHTLQGNLLIGICSTLCHYSIDFIINRQGEIKKKEWNENKYKHFRKVNFTFAEGDVLLFQYLPMTQILRITNETRHLMCRFESNEIIEMGEGFYNFFSLESEGDQLIFL